ncbi:MAG: diguanylate cyclase [Marinobacter sp.]
MAAANHRAPSLLTRVTLAMVGTILLVFSFHAAYVYSTQRASFAEATRDDVSESLQRLSKNIAPYIEAYSVNEYEKLVATETALKQHFAVVVQDYEMGEIINTPYYLSGQIRTAAGDYIPYQQQDPELNGRLSQAFYTGTAAIVGANGKLLGQVSVYASDEALAKKLNRVLLSELLSILVLAVTLSVLLVAVLRRYFLRSITHIDTAMKNCDHEGVPLLPIPDVRYREVALLSNTINTMLASIRQSREKRKIERRRLQNTIKGTHTGTWEWNVTTGETIFNDRWADIAGYTLAELGPISIDTWMSLAHPEDLQRSSDLLSKHFQGELPYYECQTRMRHKAGHWVWVLDRGSVLSWTDDGQPLMMYGTHQDITEHKEAEDKLLMAASVFRYAREGIILTSAEGIILDVNSAFSALTGYARGEVVDHSHTFLASDRHSRNFLKTILKSLREEGVWSGEYWVLRQNGSAFPSLATIAAVWNRAGETQHYVTLFADISHLKQNEDNLRQIAHYDALTGLPNRLLLSERLRHAVSVARRHRNVLAVVFLDLDGFKVINDSYGHAAGDELLIALAERMQKTLRECDTVARLGGDEFVVLLPELAQGQDCEPILRRLLAALAAPVTLGENIVQVSASLGVSLYPQNPDVDAEILLRQADMAMYQAKQRGKNQYRFFSGPGSTAADTNPSAGSSGHRLDDLSG